MPFGSIKLRPGVDVELTPSLNEAGISQSSLIRFKSGLPQKRGGWRKYISNVLGGIPRAMLAWVDILANSRVAVATTTELDVIYNKVPLAITPQTVTTNNTPNFSTVISTPTVTITDAGYTTGSFYDTVFITTPVSIGGLVLFGAYAVASIASANTFTITAASNATGTVNNAGAVPTYTTSATSSSVTVTLANHGYSVGSTYKATISTAVGGITVFGNYTVQAILSSSQFQIQISAQATSSTTVSVNGGNARITYYLAIQQSFTPQGYGLGAYGVGAFGVGTANSRSGTPITATDWTMVNAGEVLLACPTGGPIYQWDPTTGYLTAYPITSAPFVNTGICVATSLQIVIAWGSDFIGAADPLLIRWSDASNFNTWVASSTNQAGSFRIPSGSRVVSIVTSPVANLVLTDVDAWVMTYIQPPLVFGFNKIGSNCGLIAMAAAVTLNTQTYWMGNDNFYIFSGGAVQILPCSVWDAVFQNINTSYLYKIRAGTTSEFNEIIWFFPSMNSLGENDSYVQYNIAEGTWDYDTTGAMPRSAWTDPPISIATTLGATPTGIVYQHEVGTDADTSPMSYSFTTGYAAVAEGEEKVFIDWILPDFKYGTFGETGATIQLSINAADYPTDTPTVYGPYSITAATQGIPVRLRNRLLSFTIAGNDLGSFMRLGNIRYRGAADGRR